MERHRQRIQYTNSQIKRALELEAMGKSHTQISKETGIRAGSMSRLLVKAKKSVTKEASNG